MDTNLVVMISVFCGTSTLCLCCILAKAVTNIIEDRRQERLKSIAKKIQDRLRYNSINPTDTELIDDEYLRKQEAV
jgi:hypothetical protein